MKLQSLDLQLGWPESVPIDQLRNFALKKLNEYGDPLRWAITNITTSDGLRKLNIEAVVIIE